MDPAMRIAGCFNGSQIVVLTVVSISEHWGDLQEGQAALWTCSHTPGECPRLHERAHWQTGCSSTARVGGGLTSFLSLLENSFLASCPL